MPRKLCTDNNTLDIYAQQVRFPKKNSIRNIDAKTRHFWSTNVLHAQHRNHITHEQLPKIQANDPYGEHVPIHA